VNEKYAEFFGDHKPARGVVPVGKLHLGLDVAFEVTAAR
jgi:enamine deaminase RidA (YjgF/YER057c/UK114 family)